VPASAAAAPPRLKVAAVTGSVGKTTTKDLLARICAAMGPTVAARGSFNNHLGLPLTILSATYDTRFLVLEMGANHGGEIAALAQVARPDVGIVLGVAPAHIGEFGSLEAIAAAKAELPAALGPHATAVLNLDDRLVATMPTAAQVVTYGLGSDAIVQGTGLTTDDAGHLTLDVHTPQGAFRLRTGLAGEHNAINVLAATAGGLALGATPGIVAAALTGAGPDSPHRMAMTHLGGGILLLDDAYNANPASSSAALRFAAHLGGAAGAQVWAVLGEMLELGDAAPGAHRDLGALAADLAVDRLIVVGDGARGIADGAVQGGMPADAVKFFDVVPAPQDLGVAAREPGPAGTPQTVVLIKGSNSTGLWRLADALATTDLRVSDDATDTLAATGTPPGDDEPPAFHGAAPGVATLTEEAPEC
jgi:UDP-N-acetylmuramoyl-tripeptide--D-alanyl-D-alanine ligase